MRTSALSAACVVLTLSLLTTGCGGPNPSAGCIPVSLTVTYKGQPVESAQVTFRATGDGARTCQGTTDQSGRAVIGTFSTDDGALPGSYTVSVSKSAEVGGTSSGVGDPSLVDRDAAAGLTKGGPASFQDPAATYLKNLDAQGNVKEAASTLPTKYANADTSGLSFTVQGPSANDFTVDLKD